MVLDTSIETDQEDLNQNLLPNSQINQDHPQHDESLFKSNPLLNCGFISSCFFFWISPLINSTKKGNKLTLESLGDLRPQDRVVAHVKKLKEVWSR